ncbi:hypothetical protein GCM10009528_32730 [Kineococcus aurantiacus]|nr:amino acid permease [Kineococcus aurantiacus]
MQVFFVTSCLACLIALHNATARYVQKLAGDGDLPRGLGRLHPRHEAPTRASDLLALAAVVILGGLALTGADPYVGLGTSLTGLFTVGIFGVQVLVAVAVVVHFRRTRDVRWWTTLVAPVLGGIGVLVAVGAIVANYPVLTGTETGVANVLPVLLLLAVLAGPVRNALRRRASV